MLNVDKMPDVKETDEHETHLYIHASAKNTPSAIAHRYWHQELLAIQKKQEQQMMQAQGMMQQQGMSPMGQMQGESNEQSAVPLGQEMKRKVATNEKL